MNQLAEGGRQSILDRWLNWAAVGVWLVFLAVLGWKAAAQPADRSTFPAFVGGAEAWLARDNLYQPKHRVTGFRYGPAFAVSMIPLAVLPQWLGSLLWSWLNVAALLIGAWALWRWVLPGLDTPRRRAVFVLLLLPAAVRTLWTAQSNALVFALVACAAAAVVNNRWWLAALLLAAPVQIKVWPVAAGLLMCACWPRQLSVRYIVCLLAVGAAPLLVADWQYVCDQYRNWYALLTGPALERHIYRDAWTIWEVFWPPVNARVYAVLQLASALAVLGLCLLKGWQWRREILPGDNDPGLPEPSHGSPGSAQTAAQLRFDRNLAFPADATPPKAAAVFKAKLLTFVLSMWAAWQLTFGPGTERATFGLIAPLNVWAFMTSVSQPCAPWLMVPASLLMTMANSGEFERRLPDYPVVMAVHPLAVLGFAVWLVAFWAARPARSVQSGASHSLNATSQRRAVPAKLSYLQGTSSGEITEPRVVTHTGGNGPRADCLPQTPPSYRHQAAQGSSDESTALRFGRDARSAPRAGRRNRCAGDSA